MNSADDEEPDTVGHASFSFSFPPFSFGNKGLSVWLPALTLFLSTGFVSPSAVGTLRPAGSPTSGTETAGVFLDFGFWISDFELDSDFT